MGDASTQGQGAELGESRRKGGFQHPYRQGLGWGLLLRAALAPTRWCKCSATWTGRRRGGNGMYVWLREALAGQRSTRPGIPGSRSWDFSTASPCPTFRRPCEDLRIGRRFPSGLEEVGTGKPPAVHSGDQALLGDFGEGACGAKGAEAARS